MVGIVALWIPILLSAVIVFFASAIVHMVLRYHWSDYARMPGEDLVRDAIRKGSVSPGEYNFPHASSPAEMRAPDIVERFKQGPVGLVTILPSGEPAMGKSLVQWFFYSLVVGVLAAYVAGRTLGAGAEYLQVFRITGTVAFVAYAGSQPIESIWKGRKWSTTGKNIFDGLVYAAVTATVFALLWP